MVKSSLLLLACILAVAGTAVLAGHPSWPAWAPWAAWGTFMGVALVLLAGATMAAALTLRSRPEGQIVEPRGTSQKISNSLVTLSSAAILAVYAAGYHRTGSAAYKFDVQEARRKAAARIATVVVVPTTPVPALEAPPVFPPPEAPPPKKANSRASATTARKTAPSPEPTENSSATPSAPPAAGTPAGPAAQPSAQADTTQQVNYKDGTYLGWGYSRHGNIQTSVVIQDGKIVSTAIAQCLTRYSCSWIADLPGESVSRQSANVDLVSGATESSEAFSDAVAQALSKASE